MDLTKKQVEGIIFDNCLGLAVNNILTYNDANGAFTKNKGKIAGVEWVA